ncbi:MAG TPA: HEAT repeat domain-containing protein [Metabacillus sp.]|nr:HEAT repeat domain-containing protein [Metabacillus sp.]
MDKNEAIDFLKNNQPLPEDNILELHPELIKKYDDVRKYFLANPDPICIPLFLNSFGNGSGFGVYQLIEDVLVKYSHEQVVPHLIESLNSKWYGVRYWTAQIASLFPDKRLIDPLKKLLKESDPDIRSAAITALAQINDYQALRLIKNAQLQEDDPSVLEIINDVLGDLEL